MVYLLSIVGHHGRAIISRYLRVSTCPLQLEIIVALHYTHPDAAACCRGFNEHNAALETDGIEDDADIAEAIKTSYGNRPIKVMERWQSITVVACVGVGVNLVRVSLFTIDGSEAIGNWYADGNSSNAYWHCGYWGRWRGSSM